MECIVKCPKCGLTDLVYHFCATCEKHVISKKYDNSWGKIIETDETIFLVNSDT